MSLSEEEIKKIEERIKQIKNYFHEIKGKEIYVEDMPTFMSISWKDIQLIKHLLNSYKQEKEKSENHRVAFEKQTENLHEMEDLYNKEKEKNKKLEEQIKAKVMNNYISKYEVGRILDKYSESSLMINDTFIDFEKDLLGEDHWKY